MPVVLWSGLSPKARKNRRFTAALAKVDQLCPVTLPQLLFATVLLATLRPSRASPRLRRVLPSSSWIQLHGDVPPPSLRSRPLALDNHNLAGVGYLDQPRQTEGAAGDVFFPYCRPTRLQFNGKKLKKLTLTRVLDSDSTMLNYSFKILPLLNNFMRFNVIRVNDKT